MLFRSKGENKKNISKIEKGALKITQAGPGLMGVLKSIIRSYIFPVDINDFEAKIIASSPVDPLPKFRLASIIG